MRRFLHKSVIDYLFLDTRACWLYGSNGGETSDFYESFIFLNAYFVVNYDW